MKETAAKHNADGTFVAGYKDYLMATLVKLGRVSNFTPSTDEVCPPPCSSPPLGPRPGQGATQGVVTCRAPCECWLSAL